MIIILKNGIVPSAPECKELLGMIEAFPGVHSQTHTITGTERTVTEVYLLGSTGAVPLSLFESLPFVERAFRVSESFRLIGRHAGAASAMPFSYKGVTFDEHSFQVFLGQCSADTLEFVGQTFAALQRAKVTLSRIGAYKPRTSPYDFQGHGHDCLPWVFELAAKHGVVILSMEVCEERHIDEIDAALRRSGAPVGVMLQIGTRNAQNFALLKAVGRQSEYPVLYKRGAGLTLTESLNAAEYIASEGNHRIIFCLRGLKSGLAAPHRNLADLGHIPVLRSWTRLPVCVDPSHAVGKRTRSSDDLLDIFHLSAMGVIAGCNMIMTEIHPEPSRALSDGAQALLPNEIEHYVEDLKLVRECYLKRIALAERFHGKEAG